MARSEDPLEVAIALGAVFLALVAFALWFSQRDSKPARAVDVATPAPPEHVPPRTVMEAADVGDLEALRKMLDEQPQRIALRDESGWTPLHHACYRNHVEIITLLLERGAEANAVAVGECVPVHMAATEGSAAAIDALANGGADLNIADDTGVTALHYAALPGRLDVIDALIRHGAAVNMKDAKQETPLDVARRLDDSQVITAIEKAGGKSGQDVRMKDVLATLPDSTAKGQVARVWHLDMDSEPMQEATQRAKTTLPAFLAYLAEHPDSRAAVKFGLRDEATVEYVWGELVEVADPLQVTVTTPPVAVPAPPEPCQVRHDEVVDWQLKLDEDRTAGGYSQRATFEAIREEYGFLPDAIQAELDHLVDL